MSKHSDVGEMYHLAVGALSENGRLSVEELDKIVEAGLRDGKLDQHERALLFKLISKLTREDFTPEMWDRVEKLIEWFELDDSK